MGLITDAMIDSGALRRRLQSSTTGLTYWDESVGRRMFAWDTVNNRWQLVYGDTGWRTISASLDATFLTANASAVALLRRYGNTVEFRFARGAGGTTTGSNVLVYTLPSGFQFAASSVTGAAAMLLDGGTGAMTAAGLWTLGTTIKTGTWSTSTNYWGTLSFQTTDAWPATLPGTASGTIPFA